MNVSGRQQSIKEGRFGCPWLHCVYINFKNKTKHMDGSEASQHKLEAIHIHCIR